MRPQLLIAGLLLAHALVLPQRLAAAPPPTLQPEIVSVRPHDSSAFTQGLLLYQGSLYESTGQRGASTLRQVNPTTGVVVRSVDLPAAAFGEGLARVDNRLIQLTWQEEVAYVYDLQSFNVVDQYAYAGEGWGLCHDGQRLVMSNGSSALTFRDSSTFAVTGSVVVTLDGTPQPYLNELECVGDLVYANVWTTDVILRIDPSSGEVTAIIDAAGLLTASEAQAADVLNGIAWDAAAGTFLVTGKYWPKLFELRLPEPTSPDGGAAGDAGAAHDGGSDGEPTASDPTVVPGDAALRTESTSGCGCSATYAPGLLLLTLAFAPTRRKQRHQRHESPER